MIVRASRCAMLSAVATKTEGVLPGDALWPIEGYRTITGLPDLDSPAMDDGGKHSAVSAQLVVATRTECFLHPRAGVRRGPADENHGRADAHLERL